MDKVSEAVAVSIDASTAADNQYIREKTYITKQWTLSSSQKRYLPIKRVIDVILSVLALIVLSPVFLVTAIAIKIDSPGAVFFCQERTGKNGKLFKMYKFRSMVSNAEQLLSHLKDKNEMDGPVFKIAQDPRITKVGKFIRKYSIDEIPQFFNVLLGNMSLVGPRPPLPNEVMQYDSHQKRRLDVKPGLTCYWQISGRCDVSFEQWVDMDIKYIENFNFSVDLMMLFKTVFAVLSSKGAY